MSVNEQWFADITRQLSALERRVERLPRPEVSPLGALGAFQALPALRGLWTMGDIDEVGDSYDLSGEGHTLSYNGNPTYNYANLAPYIALDGTGDYLEFADTGAAGGFDVTGTETFIASAVRGLTFGGWFWFDNAIGSNEYLIAKYNATGDQRSYRALRTATGAAAVTISVDGTLAWTVSVDAAGALVTASAWYFVVGRFDPSTSLDVYVNGTWTSNTTSIPASIHDSSAALIVGARPGPADLLTGRASLCFVCTAYLSDALVSNLYQASRVLFGV